jgi:DNA replication initiation complex subunit (GINS family)
MLTYNDLYEILRKEKYSETLQALPKNFVEDFAQYVSERKIQAQGGEDLFAEAAAKSKKQLENSISLFRELILRRKKKMLNLVFVAAETGIMKKDYETMLEFEKEIFDGLIKAFETGDKQLTGLLQNGGKERPAEMFKLVMFTQSVEQFVDMSGNAIGPFNVGQIANLDKSVGDILVSSGKASFVDEE